MGSAAFLLGAGFVLALGALIVLAITLPRRVARSVVRLLAEEQAKGENRGRAVQASAAELASVVGTSRALLNEQAQLVGAHRALVEWLASFVNTQYAGVETVRKPAAPPPLSRERPSPAPRGAAPAVAPPGSAPPFPSGTAPQVAAGLTRPSSRPLLRTETTPPLLPVRRGGTLLGLAPQAGEVAQPRQPMRAAQTMPSIPSIAQSTERRPIHPVTIEHRGVDDEGGAA